jgi:hypothetical protein
MDLGFEGPKFTWNNRQDCDTNIKVRLDRAVSNGHFSQVFQNCSVENLITTSSDHYAILVSLKGSSRVTMQHLVQQGFRFEAMWLRAPDYHDVMEKVWADGSDGSGSLQSTSAKLGHVATSLKDWNRATFWSVRKKIRQLEGKLWDIRECLLTEESVIREKEVENELCEMFEREEIMARQRSRVEWLREGDRNTSFFSC